MEQNMNNLQIDNSYFADKVLLRFKNLPHKKTITVLDCFYGNGKIWDKVKLLSKDKDIKILPIEIKNINNKKFLKGIKLSEYNVIDLDSYGCPFEQLEIIFKYAKENLQYHPFIFMTFIQVMQGGLPYNLLFELGYTKEMIKKAPMIFNRNGFEKMKNYLANSGVVKIRYRMNSRKHYIFFKL